MFSIWTSLRFCRLVKVKMTFLALLFPGIKEEGTCTKRLKKFDISKMRNDNSYRDVAKVWTQLHCLYTKKYISNVQFVLAEACLVLNFLQNET